jgi:hypothetical protein
MYDGNTPTHPWKNVGNGPGFGRVRAWLVANMDWRIATTSAHVDSDSCPRPSHSQRVQTISHGILMRDPSRIFRADEELACMHIY